MSDPESPAETFGQEIRYAREACGWSQAKLADKLCCQQPYVSKVERGAQLASATFAEQCDRVFGTPGVYARMRQRAADNRYPSWFVSYLRLEREAVTICDYSAVFVMGVLQTAEYAAAVNRAAHPRETEAEIKARVELRMQRREIFESNVPPLLWVILHEAVNLLTQQDGKIILYEETYERGLVDDSAEAVAEAQAAYERLRADALSPADSLALIRHVMEAYTQ